MKKLRNSSGSALLWTVMVLSMLMIFSTVVLTMAMAYSKRNLNQNQNQQAYYTALSAVNLVAKQFSGIYPKDSPQQKIIDKLNGGDSIEIDDLHLPSEMGKVKVTMSMRSGGPIVGDIVITADAEKNGETYRLSAILKGDVTIIHPENPDSDYGGDGTPGLGAGGITGGNGMSTDPDTDIYIWNNNEFGIDSYDRAEDAIHMGALYTNGPVNIVCTGGDDSYTHVHGEIISTKNIAISNTASVGLLTGELLLGGRTSCCDNVDPSFIHTTGAVTMSDLSRMGGNITAKQINLSDKARVAGDLEADEVNISCFWEPGIDVYTVQGDITANKVTISNSAIIVGDITANEVTISQQATVVGSITANKVTISTNENDIGKVSGDVTAATVILKNGAYVQGSVLADSITMSESSQVRGDVTVNKVTMGDSCIIAGTLSYCAAGSTVRGSVGSKNQMVNPPAPVDVIPPLPPITSQLPPKPAPPPMPPIPTDPPPQEIWGGNITVGDPDYDSYYIVESDGINIAHLTVDSEKNIFIYIPDGYEATVKNIIDDTPAPPNLFFILGNGSKLNLGGDNGQGNSTAFPAYVWSPEGSGANLEMDPGSSIEGGIWVDIVGSHQNNEYHWIPPDLTVNQPEPPDPEEPEEPEEPENPDDPELPGPEDEVIVNWGVDAYENR